jgi:hypothetical protein
MADARKFGFDALADHLVRADDNIVGSIRPKPAAETPTRPVIVGRP